MLTRLFRSSLGSRFVEFMRGPSGKTLDKALVRYFNFSLLMLSFSRRGGFPYIPVLLLFTTGRKTGETRSTVMPYLFLDGRHYLIGSNGARRSDPAWVGNLRANPEASIRVDWHERQVRARLLDAGSDERHKVWAHAATKTSQYNNYQSQTDRIIPVVALDPVA